MAQIPVTSETLETVLSEVDAELAAVLGPVLVDAIAKGVATGVEKDILVHDIQGGENFDLMAAVHQGIEVVTLIKLMLEVYDKLPFNAKQGAKPGLIEAAKKEPAVKAMIADGKIDKVLQKVAEVIEQGNP
jgi:hypothetical protein